MLRSATLLLAIIAMPPIMRAQTPDVPAPADKVTPPWADRVMHVGGSIKAPVLIYSVVPEFTEEARKKHFNGNVQVYLWVDEHGNPSHVMVARGVGMGLDEKAVQAVRQYKFNPATQD